MSDKTPKAAELSAEPQPLPQTGADRDRFVDSLYRRFRDELCGWLRRHYGAGPPEPEDIAQATFEKIAALDSLELIRDPRAFLYTIASRTAVSEIRSLIRARKYIDAQLNEQGIGVEEITPERVYTAKERFTAVIRAMENLSEQQREILLRCKVRGQTYDEISAETGWSPATISRHLKATLLALYQAEHKQ